MFGTLDCLFLTITGVCFFTFLAKRWSSWQVFPDSRDARDWTGLIRYLLAQRPVLKKPWTGLAHLVMVWGTFLFLLVVILDQADALFPALQAAAISVLLDITGVLMLVSTLFFLIKGWIRPGITTGIRESRKRLLPLLLFLLVILTGFLAEGARVCLQHTGIDLASPSPIGSLFTVFLTDSPRLMQIMIRLHFYLVLLLIGTLPLTLMRHAVSGSVNVLHRVPSSHVPFPRLLPEQELVDSAQVEQIDWRLFLGWEACVGCNRCTEQCPATISGKELAPGHLMQEAVRQSDDKKLQPLVPSDFESPIFQDALWHCTHCLACVEHCPVFCRPVDLVSLLRRHQVLARGDLPTEARSMMRNLELYGDPLGRGPALRINWMGTHTIPVVSDKNTVHGTLLWVGCSGAFHPQAQQSLRAFSAILKAGQVPVITLGNKELCCGEPARRLGDEDLFREMAASNINQLNRSGIDEIITHCPHCYHMLKNEYPAMGGTYSVRHSSEVIARLIAGHKIELNYALPVSPLTIHDPCLLGRGNQLYQPLRDICRAIPGVNLVELPRTRENAFCCGGGGGRMWLHEKQGRALNRIRSEEIAASKAQLTATACPYCQTMLQDGLAGLENHTPVKARDIAEIVASCMGITVE